MCMLVAPRFGGLACVDVFGAGAGHSVGGVAGRRWLSCEAQGCAVVGVGGRGGSARGVGDRTIPAVVRAHAGIGWELRRNRCLR